jgi:parvulin-like peptidyl-prolyl isomerase
LRIKAYLKKLFIVKASVVNGGAMKRKGILYPVMFLAAVAITPLAAEAEIVIVDGVAAQVNDNSITIGDVMTLLDTVKPQISAKYSGDELKKQMRLAYTNALNSLIERRLILDAYAKQEFKLPEPLIQGRIEEIVQDMSGGDQNQLMTALAKEKISYDEWKGQIREHVIVSLMRRMNVEQNVTIPFKAAQQYYDENIDRFKNPAKIKLRMIVIDGGGDDSSRAVARRKADETRQKLAGGADFAETAKAVSSGNKAASGGDWGWIEPKILRPELADVAAKLKQGEMSPVVGVEDQFYILKVEERKEGATAQLAEVQQQIERELRRLESEKLYTAWIERLRKNACVKVFPINVL